MDAHPTPFLAVDLAAFDRNAGKIADAVIRRGGKRWRPHVKSMRAPQLARRLIAAGASGLTVATLDEAAVMVETGFDDLLIANEVVGDAALARLAALNRHATVAVCVDAHEPALALAKAARVVGRRLPVLIDVDIGLRRCGVAPGPACVALATEIAALPELDLRGLMAWEGHATHIAPGPARRAEIERSVARLLDAAGACRQAGLPVPVVSCGGTGTFDVTSGIDGVTEVQAGGGAFGDRRARIEWQLDFEPALLVWTTVISRPTPRRVVCDGGWKAMAPFPVKPAPQRLATCGEVVLSAEHASFELPRDATRPKIGDHIAWEVGYADSITPLHDRMVALHGGAATNQTVWQLPRRRSG